MTGAMRRFRQLLRRLKCLWFGHIWRNFGGVERMPGGHMALFTRQCVACGARKNIQIPPLYRSRK
jgi:hypothetical protein